MKKNKYTITNKRVREYLYSIGFYYEKVKTEEGEVYLFERSPLLKEAMTFYTQFKGKMMNREK